MTFLDQYIVSRTKSRMRLRIPQLKSNETAVKIFDEVRTVSYTHLTLPTILLV